jgi:2-keto-4-pentenoate hydratase
MTLSQIDSQVARATLVNRVADRLTDAATRREPCRPVRDLIRSGDVELAYAVQRTLTDRRVHAGAAVTGRKIGLTSKAVQQQLGVHEPDFGVLFDDMAVDESTPVPSELLLQPKAEAEIAFVLSSDLADGEVSLERVRAAIGYAAVSLEIVDSRIARWDITYVDTVADNASSGLYVLGSQQLTLDEFEPSEVAMTMRLDGEVSSTGTGAACLGDPLNAVAWLARTALRFGDPLLAGQVILSGALGPMIAVGPGSQVHAEITGKNGDSLGSVSATFSDKEAAQ